MPRSLQDFAAKENDVSGLNGMKLLPMCPEWTRVKLVGGSGIEPLTPAV